MMKKICCFFFFLSLCFLNVSAANKTVIVCGDTVMINGQYNGVLVSGQFDFEIDHQLIQTHPDDSVRIGDLIIEANHQPVIYTSDLNDIISSISFDQNSIAPVTVKLIYLPPIYYEEYAQLKTTEIAEIVKKRIEEAIEEHC